MGKTEMAVTEDRPNKQTQFMEAIGGCEGAVRRLQRFCHEIKGEPEDENKVAETPTPSLAGFLTSGREDVEEMMKTISDCVAELKEALL